MCVSVNDKMLSRWLGYALAARLDGNLVRGLLPGRGLGVVGCAASAPLEDVQSGRTLDLRVAGVVLVSRLGGPQRQAGFGLWRWRLIRRPGQRRSRV